MKETEEKEEWVSKHIEVLAGECRGCEICAIECSLGHVGVPVVRRARINVFQALGVSRPEVCQLCDLQACAKACPQKAIRRDAQRGIQVVDEEKCVGCGACVAACPYRGIRLDPATTKPMFCDLCGGAPKCVAACPFGALVYTETRNKREG